IFLAAGYQPVCGPKASPSRFRIAPRRICLSGLPTRLDPHFHSRAVLNLLRHPIARNVTTAVQGYLTAALSLRLSASALEPTKSGRVNLPPETLGFRRPGFLRRLSVVFLALSLRLSS